MKPTAPLRNKFKVIATTPGVAWSHDAVIRVYDEAGNVIETHEHRGDFKEW